jgi:hypothetical protein
MPEIDLGPVSPQPEPQPGQHPEPQPGPQPEPGLLGFGPWAGRAGPDDPAGTPWARWWRRLPARWRRPVPRTVVAIGSAALAAIAMALYLDRPVEVVAAIPQPARLLAPESWLEVQEGNFPVQVELTDELATRLSELRPGHPADAILVFPLADFGGRLLGLPPGRYRVHATCSLGRSFEGTTEPARVVVLLRGPSDFSGGSEFACDGTPQVTQDRLTVNDYQAFFSEYYFLFEEEEHAGDPALIEQAEPLVVVSITPVD